MVAEALRLAGHRVGLYTSPHLVDVRERMLVAGRPITAEAFAQWTETLRPSIEETDASFFEATTAIAFADCASRGAEIVVAEVGLGGRLDATNVLQPVVCAVTNVAADHAEYLGTSLERVAWEKAGIAKRGVPFVAGETDPAILEALTAEAERRGAHVIVVPAGVQYAGQLATYGSHQRRNAAVAQAVLQQLPTRLRPDAVAVRAGLARGRLPGRLDLRGEWLFDVAHNAAGVATLSAALADLSVKRPVHALVAILADKDWPDMLKTLAGAVDRVWASVPPTAPVERRWDLHEVVRRFPQVTVEADFERALAAVQVGAGTVLVTGSFHTVGDAMARLPGFQPVR